MKLVNLQQLLTLPKGILYYHFPSSAIMRRALNKISSLILNTSGIEGNIYPSDANFMIYEREDLMHLRECVNKALEAENV